MRIKKIEIGAFGKFSDYTLSFKHPFQLVYGQNEDGKTTIMTFISMMFYGDQGRSQSIEQNPRKKYTPWSGKPMEGALTFLWKGEEYYLSKQFGDTPGRDKVSLTNLTTQKEPPLNRREEIGMKFFGLDLSGFQRSSFISQLGIIEPGRGTDRIAEKLLANLVDTGDEDVSGQEAIQRLEKAKHALVRPRASTGRLTLLEEEQTDLLNQRQHIVDLLEGQEENQAALSYAESLSEELKSLERQQKTAQIQAKAHSIKQLLHGAKQLELEKSDLEKDGVSIKELEELLLKARSLLADKDTISAGLAPLAKSLENQKQSITKEEVQKLEQLISRQEKALALNNLWTEKVQSGIIKLQDYEKETQETNRVLIKKEEELAKLAPFITSLSRGEETQATLQQQEADINYRIECDERVYSQQEILRNEQLEIYEPQLNDLKNPMRVYNIPLLIVGVIVTLLGGALGFLIVSPLAFLSVIGLAAFFLAFPLKGAEIDTQEVEALEEKIALVEKELNTAKEEHELVHNQRLVQLESIKEAKNQWVNRHAQEPELKEKYSALTQDESGLKAELQQLNYRKNTVAESLAALEDTFSFLHLTEKLSSLKLDEWTDISNQLESNAKSSQQKVKTLLDSKSAHSLREFEQKHFAYLSNQSRQAQVGEMEKELADLDVVLLNKLTPLGAKEARDITPLLDALEKNLLGYNKDLNQLNVTGQALALPLPTVKGLEETLEGLAPHDQAVATLEELKEGALRLKELEEKGLQEEIQLLQKNLQAPPRSLEDLDLELLNLNVAVKNMQDYYDALSLALKAMEQAQEEMRSSFGPLVNQKTSEIFALITKEKYDSLRVDQEYQIAVKEGVHFRSWGYLSGGTTDQAYLALRLAISQLIAPKEGALPLLLDDILIQYDDDRAKATLAFLLQYSRDSDTQILLFSCHNRMKELVKELHAPGQSIS